jgi:hypothetical protein
MKVVGGQDSELEDVPGTLSIELGVEQWSGSLVPLDTPAAITVKNETALDVPVVVGTVAVTLEPESSCAISSKSDRRPVRLTTWTKVVQRIRGSQDIVTTIKRDLDIAEGDAVIRNLGITSDGSFRFR